MPSPTISAPLSSAISLQQRHLRAATRALLHALHYARFFGKPIAEFSAEHNAQRADAAERTVRAYAEQAGQFAFFAGFLTSEWEFTQPEAMEVWAISDGVCTGWHNTKALMAGTVVS